MSAAAPTDGGDGGGFEWVSEEVYPDALGDELEPAAPHFAFTVEEYDDRPSHCTIFPRTPADPMAEWVSADGDSFVHAGDMR